MKKPSRPSTRESQTLSCRTPQSNWRPHRSPWVNLGSSGAQINGQAARLPLVVTAGKGPNLLGRDWLSPCWHSVLLCYESSSGHILVLTVLNTSLYSQCSTHHSAQHILVLTKMTHILLAGHSACGFAARPLDRPGGEGLVARLRAALLLNHYIVVYTGPLCVQKLAKQEGPLSDPYHEWCLSEVLRQPPLQRPSVRLFQRSRWSHAVADAGWSCLWFHRPACPSA